MQINTYNMPSCRATGSRLWCLGAAVLIVCAICWVPLWRMTRYALSSGMYSHVLLIPFISALLVYRKRDALKPDSEASHSLSLCFLLFLLIALLATLLTRFAPFEIVGNDTLSLHMFSFVVLVFAAVTASLGRKALRTLIFPLFFLFFMVPMPQLMEAWFESCLVDGTTVVLPWMLTISETPFVHDGRVFAIPGLTFEVAQQCSGIRSSFVLFMTSLLAGHVLLRSPWRKAVLAVLFYPIGIARNAFRILTIALLTIHVDSSVIDGPIHHRGGPIFFALSLIPFFLILIWFVKTEKAKVGLSV